MSFRTMEDLIKETITGDESDYELRTAVEISEGFRESDVTFLLSWQSGIMLVEALKKIQEGKDAGLDDADIEGSLTEKDKSMIYGAYLLSESFED